MYTIKSGKPQLGTTFFGSYVNFCIFSTTAQGMQLKIYCSIKEEKPIVDIKIDKSVDEEDNLFCIQVENIKEGMAYVWQVIDKQGNVSKPLIDPYAYSVKEYPEGSNMYRNIIVEKVAYKGNKPRIRWEETIIYELHVGSFTKHPNNDSKKDYRGTFEGLIKKIPYLKELGITTIELLPVFKWNHNTLRTIHPVTKEPLKDEWGYNTIAFFALDDSYSANKASLEEIRIFKEFIRVAHANNLEVILDVVYNHSGEGSDETTIFNFKALGKKVYYKFLENGFYMNCSGTGNTLNTSHTVVKTLIMDSLRYWIIDMGVDGFRFDLASILGQDSYGRWQEQSLLKEIAEDPITSGVKLIAESWDAKGSYDVGRMPYPFAEWSDYFRDTIRRFLRGDLGLTGAVAKCVEGVEIHHTDKRKSSNNNIHFITAHDGFTMWDLVSYDNKNNYDNGEENRDGNNTNYSHNCGMEGTSCEKNILELRMRFVKNYMAMLFLSKGVPMLLMGDEIGRTQQGNNNAYCQDNFISWVDWERRKDFEDIFYFVKSLIAFRKGSSYFKGFEECKVSWHGIRYDQPDWSYHSRSLAWHIKGVSESIYIIANSYIESLIFKLPETQGNWYRIMDTSKQGVETFITEGILIKEQEYKVKPFSICMLKERQIKE